MGDGCHISWLKQVYLIPCPTEMYLSHGEFKGELVSSPYPTPFIQCSQRLHPFLPSTTSCIQTRWITSTTTPAPALPHPLVRSSIYIGSRIRRRLLKSPATKNLTVLFPIIGTPLNNQGARLVYRQPSRLRPAMVSIVITPSSTVVLRWSLQSH